MARTNIGQSSCKIKGARLWNNKFNLVNHHLHKKHDYHETLYWSISIYVLHHVVECVRWSIFSQLSIIQYAGLCVFQFTHFSCDDWGNICTLFYYHHQIGSMNYYLLFRVRSWNNGVRCMSLYIRMQHFVCVLCYCHIILMCSMFYHKTINKYQTHWYWTTRFYNAMCSTHLGTIKYFPKHPASLQLYYF